MVQTNVVKKKDLELKSYRFRVEERKPWDYRSTWKYVHCIHYSPEMARQELRERYKREIWKLTYLDNEPIEIGLIITS